MSITRSDLIEKCGGGVNDHSMGMTYRQAFRLILIPGWLELARRNATREFNEDLFMRKLQPISKETIQARNRLYGSSLLTISLVAMALYSGGVYAVVGTIFAAAVANYWVVPAARELDERVCALQTLFNLGQTNSSYFQHVLSDLYIAYL